MLRAIVTCLVLTILPMAPRADGAEDEVLSHSPMRALPTPSNRPMAVGRGRFVDPKSGDDEHPGTKLQPWKTLAAAANELEPGDTLYLRGGVYHKAVVLKNSGSKGQPITIRAYPGELAVLDAGYREFVEDPASAWGPVTGGVEGEFRSTRAYPTGGGFGNFADSMVPFHRYMNFHDLRSKNELFRPSLSDRADDPEGMCCGPGVLRNRETGRIHIRLSHTQLAGLGESGYRGETDPRKLPLIIAGRDDALRIEGARHVRIQDLVIRGAQRAAIIVDHCEDVDLDGLTLYGGNSALRISKTRGLRLLNSALRGHAAPWHSRFHHKNRAGSGYLVIAGGSDFELAHCQSP